MMTMTMFHSSKTPMTTMPDVLYGAHITSDKTCWDTLQKYLFFPVLLGKNGNRRQMNDHPPPLPLSNFV